MVVNINGQEFNLNEGEHKIKIWKDCFKEDILEICDKNNNIIYYETSNGFWEQWTRNKNGYVIYYENSKGRSYKKEYNENNELIYLRDSKRGILIDKRNKIVELTLDDIAKKFNVNVKDLKIKK